MICPQCLEDYEFVDFEVDEKTLEHKVIVKCACPFLTLLPEKVGLASLQDPELAERVRINRLLRLRTSITRPCEKKSRLDSGWAKAIDDQMNNLKRYLALVSEDMTRRLKTP